jgi:acyl-CoA reductase-like NAD-dependent aldehyde dehydrogenase
VPLADPACSLPVLTGMARRPGRRPPLSRVRQSGLGRRYGEQGFEEYLEVKAIGLPA